MISKSDEKVRALAMLRYQADRYRSMKNGGMSQRLNAEIRRLEGEIDADNKM